MYFLYSRRRLDRLLVLEGNNNTSVALLIPSNITNATLKLSAVRPTRERKAGLKAQQQLPGHETECDCREQTRPARARGCQFIDGVAAGWREEIREGQGTGEGRVSGVGGPVTGVQTLFAGATSFMRCETLRPSG